MNYYPKGQKISLSGLGSQNKRLLTWEIFATIYSRKYTVWAKKACNSHLVNFLFYNGFYHYMKRTNSIVLAITQLEYRRFTDCTELRLLLLSLLGAFIDQCRYLKNKREFSEFRQAYKELERLYKSFTGITKEEGSNDHKAQFEFTKLNILDCVNRLYPQLQVSNVA